MEWYIAGGMLLTLIVVVAAMLYCCNRLGFDADWLREHPGAQVTGILLGVCVMGGALVAVWKYDQGPGAQRMREAKVNRLVREAMEELEGDWEEFRSPERQLHREHANFSILFPPGPVKSSVDPNGVVTHEVELKHITFSIAHRMVPQEEFVRDSLHLDLSIDGVKTGDNRWQIAGFGGSETEWKCNTRGIGNPCYLSRRTVIVDELQYVIIVKGLLGKLDHAGDQKFFSSFKILS
jgi:hypothetical protein